MSNLIKLTGPINKSNNVTKANEQVPGLGNVPVIGNLLKYKKNEDNLEELLIFIAPRIL